jgi:protein-disulfide isomerase
MRVGRQAGLSQQAFEDCFKDQALIDKLTADREFAVKVLKIPGTPTFFINGEIFEFEGVPTFEEFEKKVKPLLKS